METKEKVVETLKAATKPLRAGEIAEIAGLDKKDVEKAINKLKNDGIIHSPIRCCYAVK
jgi:predicted transcriptional regulator